MERSSLYTIIMNQDGSFNGINASQHSVYTLFARDKTKSE